MSLVTFVCPGLWLSSALGRMKPSQTIIDPGG